MARGQERTTVKEPGYTMKVYSVAFTPDGRGLVTAGETRAYQLWPIDY